MTHRQRHILTTEHRIQLYWKQLQKNLKQSTKLLNWKTYRPMNKLQYRILFSYIQHVCPFSNLHTLRHGHQLNTQEHQATEYKTQLGRTLCRIFLLSLNFNRSNKLNHFNTTWYLIVNILSPPRQQHSSKLHHLPMPHSRLVSPRIIPTNPTTPSTSSACSTSSHTAGTTTLASSSQPCVSRQQAPTNMAQPQLRIGWRAS